MAIWDSAHKHANIALSGGGLTLTCTANDPSFSGIGVRSVDSHPSGKYYLEHKVTIGNNAGAPIGLAVSSFDTAVAGWLGLDASGNSLGYFGSDGSIWIKSVQVATIQTWVINDTVCMAVDVGVGLVWFRVNGGNWNNNAAADPAS